VPPGEDKAIDRMRVEQFSKQVSQNDYWNSKSSRSLDRTKKLAKIANYGNHGSESQE
jgi:hypothetical protein